MLDSHLQVYGLLSQWILDPDCVLVWHGHRLSDVHTRLEYVGASLQDHRRVGRISLHRCQILACVLHVAYHFIVRSVNRIWNALHILTRALRLGLLSLVASLTSLLALSSGVVRVPWALRYLRVVGSFSQMGLRARDGGHARMRLIGNLAPCTSNNITAFLLFDVLSLSGSVYLRCCPCC